MSGSDQDTLSAAIVASDRQQNEKRPPLPLNCYTWNDRHAGEDIFVVGAGPQLAFLTDEQVAALAPRTVIGGNNTFYKVNLSYFLSAYQIEIWKALRHMPAERIIHFRTPLQTTDTQDVNVLNRSLYHPDVGLPRFLTPPVPTLYTMRNQAIGMLHLALVMGARRIFTIGVDQTNYAYFWQYDDKLRTRLRRDMHYLHAQRFRDQVGAETRDIHLEGVYDRLGQSAEDAELMPFYEDFTDVFQTYIGWARAFGCEVYTTTPGSVIERAGASYMSLDDALAGKDQNSLPQASSAVSASSPTWVASVAPKLRKAFSVANSLTQHIPPVEGPVLIATAPGVNHPAPDILNRLGIRMADPAVFDTLGAEVVRACWTKVSENIVQREPLWDYPEGLLVYQDHNLDLRFWTLILDALKQRFAAPDVRAALGLQPGAAGADPDLESLPTGWGWQSDLDLTLLPVLESMFPTLKVLYVHDAQPLSAAKALRDAFQRKVRAIPGLTLDEGGLIRAVDGQPPRQMQVFHAAGPCPARYRRFTMRCESMHGAEELLRVYHHAGMRAVSRLGPERAVAVTVQSLAKDPRPCLQKLSALWGRERRASE